jgi:hypothetical protein
MIKTASLQHAPDHLQETPNAGRAADASALWREKNAQQFDDTDLAAVRGILAKAVLLNEPKWAEARNGGAADAIALAVAEWPIAVLTSRVDLIMTAVLLAAMTGSAAAAVVLAHVVRQLPGVAKRHKRIAASWLARNLRAALAKRARRPSAPTRLLMKSASVNGGGRPQ